MSNAVIHPLIDASIVQINSIRVMLDDSPAVHLLDGARMQLIAAKQLLGIDLRPAPKLQGSTLSEIIPDRRVPEAAPKKSKQKNKKKRKGFGGRAARGDIQNAFVAILSNAKDPMSKADMDDLLFKNSKDLGCEGIISLSMTKAALLDLVKTGRVTKLGERSNAKYVLPKARKNG